MTREPIKRTTAAAIARGHPIARPAAPALIAAASSAADRPRKALDKRASLPSLAHTFSPLIASAGNAGLTPRFHAGTLPVTFVLLAQLRHLPNPPLNPPPPPTTFPTISVAICLCSRVVIVMMIGFKNHRAAL